MHFHIKLKISCKNMYEGTLVKIVSSGYLFTQQTKF